MKTRIHGVAGVLGMVLITLFFSSSLIIELVGDVQAVVWVKQLI